MKPTPYYLCGCCCNYHPADWNGDCREDAARFAPDELDARHTPFGWVEVDTPDTGAAEEA